MYIPSKALILVLLLLAPLCCQSEESKSAPANPVNIAPAISLAKPYHNKIDLKQYWISEKLDGVRAYWDGQRLITRGGTIINAPIWFTKDFPKQELDGELWIARGQFQQTVSTIRKKIPIDREWRKVTYQVFDLPKSPSAFTIRLKLLKDLFAIDKQQSSTPVKTIQLIRQRRISNQKQLTLLLNSVVSEGAEGLMLRRGDSFHQAGRSDDLLKLKPDYDDDAIVIAHIEGKGRNSGRMGSLLVQWKSGLQFHIGTGFTDQQRLSPPPVGSTISFKFYGLTDKGLPRHASFLRRRTDADL